MIDVHYAGLRYGDIMARRGIPSRFHRPPFVAGQEAAGVVAALGDGVERVGVGDRVFVNVLSGAYAERLVAEARTVRVLPDGVDLATSLAYMVNMPTAYLVVFEWGAIQPGQTVLLHAAAGGVGTLVQQILKSRLPDVEVIAISSPGKLEHCLANGATHVIDRTTQDYVERVREITDGRGVDVCLNSVSGPTLSTDHEAITTRGTWVIYGIAAGAAPIEHGRFGYRGITIKPMSILAWQGTDTLAAADRFAADWLVNEPLLVPNVRPLEEVAEAQRAMQNGSAPPGKTVFALR